MFNIKNGMMKKISLLLMALMFVFLQVDAQRTYALLAGISNYNAANVNNLSSTTNDVKEMQTVLKNQGAVVATITSKYVTPENVMKKLDAIVKLANPQDKIIFFFSGHGTTGSIVCYGPELMSYKALINKLSLAKTKNIFCFVDACMSGSVTDDAGSDYSWGQASGNKITFMMGSRANEYSLENRWLGNGYFSQALLKGLRGKADTNGDRKITVSELYKYVYMDVTERTKNTKNPQHPQLIGPKSNFEVVLTKW